MAETLVEVRNHPRKGRGLGFAHAAQLERELALPRPVEDGVAGGVGEVLPGGVRVEGQLLGQLLEERVVLDDEILPADAPRLERAAAHAFCRIGHDQLRDEP